MGNEGELTSVFPSSKPYGLSVPPYVPCTRRQAVPKGKPVPGFVLLETGKTKNFSAVLTT